MPWEIMPHEAGAIVLDLLSSSAGVVFSCKEAWLPSLDDCREARARARAEALSLSPGGSGEGDQSGDEKSGSFDADRDRDRDGDWDGAGMGSGEQYAPAFYLHGPTVLAFVEAVRRRYRHCDFHSFSHGLHVCQASSMLLRATSSEQVLSPMERTATILCALSHDVDHPGINNAFLQSIDSPVAMTYNDVSILENHHTATTFEIIRASGTNCLGTLESPEFRRCRALMVRAILATDMSGHFDMTKELKSMAAPFEAGAEEKVRNRLAEVVVHSADVSGQVLEWDVAQLWSNRVISEFATQADLEQARGLDTAPFMLGLDKRSRQMGLQKGFCSYVLTALWQPLSDLYEALEPQMNELSKNAAMYAQFETEARE